MSNQIAPIDQFSKELAQNKKKFQSVLPAHIPPERFMRTVVGAFQNNPSLLNLNRESVMVECQKAAQDGLILDGREAALVPFKGKAKYMPMVAGVIKKMWNSGELTTINAVIVCANDKFNYNPGKDTVPDHNPDWFGDRGDMVGVYAVAKLKNGGSVVDIMNMKEIAKVRAAGSSGSGPWKDWFEEMSKKSVLHRISKMLPSSSEMDDFMQRDFDHAEEVPVQETAKPEPKVVQRATADDLNATLNTEVNEDTGEIVDAEYTEESKTDDPI